MNKSIYKALVVAQLLAFGITPMLTASSHMHTVQHGLPSVVVEAQKTADQALKSHEHYQALLQNRDSCIRQIREHSSVQKSAGEQQAEQERIEQLKETLGDTTRHMEAIRRKELAAALRKAPRMDQISEEEFQETVAYAQQIRQGAENARVRDKQEIAELQAKIQRLQKVYDMKRKQGSRKHRKRR